jgi:hypothetical protein
MSKDGPKQDGKSRAAVAEGINKRRSVRVVLRVPISISAMLSDGRRVIIEAHSLVVNAHGGLLDVGMEMVRGQKIQLRNLGTEVVTAGNVLRVENSTEGRFSVAFEFATPSPHFWPVSFPPDDWSAIEIEA